MKRTPLILASQSPRRKSLLSEARVEFEVIPANVDEEDDSALTPEENVRALARTKALQVAARHRGRYVLGADTLVALGDDIIGKPVDRDDASRILMRLGGKTHRVITGFALALPDGSVVCDSVTSRVLIKPLDPQMISDYIETGEPMDKAGAYAIQGEGRRLVAGYEGSYDNIVGLPVAEVLRMLEERGCPLRSKDASA